MGGRDNMCLGRHAAGTPAPDSDGRLASSNLVGSGGLPLGAGGKLLKRDERTPYSAQAPVWGDWIGSSFIIESLTADRPPKYKNEKYKK